MKKYTTGITVLDSQLSGGIPAGSLILLIEKPGAGAEIISFQFAVEGIKKGESVLYITTDELSEHVIEHIKMYFTDFNPDENFKLVSFVSKTISDMKEYLRSFTHDPLRFLRLTLSKSKYDRIIVNNLNTFIRDYSEKEVLSFVEELSRKVKGDNSVALILLTEGTTEKMIENTLKTIADGIFELDVQERENEIQRRLKIIKIRRCMVPKNIFRYDITDKGIRMESLMRVI